MNLIFHDRTAAASEPGAAMLVIERKGNFYFSAGAVKRLALDAGTLVLPAQDTDTNAWYMLTGGGPAVVNNKPFALRRVGGKSGSRLVFSSTIRAKAYYAANQVADGVNAVHLRIGMEPVEQPFVGKLYPLEPVGQPSTAAVVAKAVAKVPLSAGESYGPMGIVAEQVQTRIRAYVTLLGDKNLRTANPVEKTRALGLLSKHEALLPSVKGAVELFGALKGEEVPRG